MNRRIGSFVVAVLSVACSRAAADTPSPGGAGGPGAAGASGRGAPVPVLVELFTSEGCSSCPPADAELARLARSQPVAGVRVVPLALHVDYWNDLGWPDPFSTAANSARQRSYARSLGLGRGVYTPQAVVDGAGETNGADHGSLARVIAEAATRAHVAVAIAPGRAASGEIGVVVQVGPAAADAMVALTEDDLVVDVPRGENAGRKLSHLGVARSLRRLGPIDPAHGARFEASLAVPPGASRDHLRVVAFAQDPRTGHVLGTGLYVP